MNYELTVTNAVITAQKFNPSIFSQLWLVRNGLVGETDFRKGSIFTDEIAKIETPQFSLLVVGPQLQLVPYASEHAERELAVVTNTLTAIVRLLPETPITALGLNFHWNVWSDRTPIKDVSRRLFYREDLPLLRAFGVDSANFGTYASRDERGFRMKMSVLPIDGLVEIDGEQVPQGRLDFGFNFHFDIPQIDRLHQVEAQLAQWLDIKSLTQQIVTEVAELEA